MRLLALIFALAQKEVAIRGFCVSVRVVLNLSPFTLTVSV
jgi:hypothetical protein